MQMRTIGAAVALACVVTGMLNPAFAQEACAPGHDKLGVSRTITINAAGGPAFGMQYKGQPLRARCDRMMTAAVSA